MVRRPLLSCIGAFIAGIFICENILRIAIIAILFILCEILCYLSKKKGIYLFRNFYTKKIKLVLFICFILGGIYFYNFNFFRIEEVRNFNGESKELIGIIRSEGEDKNSYQEYILKNNTIDGKKIKSDILLKANKKLQYGNKVKIKAGMALPIGARNENTFDYAKYLRTLNIYIVAEANDIITLSENNLSIVERFSFFIRNKVRKFTNETLDSTNAGILNALIIGDESQLEYLVEENYKKAGMLHLLVVSGGHTVFLIMLVKFICSFFYLSKNLSKALYIFTIFLYIFITGGTSSILRAGICIIIVIFAGLIGRENDSFTTLGLVAFILLINNPNTLYSLSFLLSFSGVIGIMICYPKIRERLVFLPTAILEPLSLTLAAQLFVTPIMIYSFNVIYWGGIISNILTLNLSGIIMMAGIVLFSLYLFVPPLVIFPMKIVELLISIMNKIAEAFSSIKWLIQYITSPNLISLGLYYIILIYSFTKRKKYNEKSLIIIKHPKISIIVRKNFRKIIAFCGIISILILNIKIIDFDKSLKISMIDIGHGDSILITTPNDKKILIDTGDKYYKGEVISDMGEQVIIPYLLKKGIKNLDMLILTHMDSDHIGGYESVAKIIDIKTLGLSINSGKKDEYKKIKKIAKENKINIKSLKRGDTFKIDGINFKVLMPKKKDKIDEENNDSIVLLMEYENKKVLFMGDLEKEGERELLSLEKDIDIDVLKVGHHGSITSSTADFIEKTTPKVSLISVGNRFKSLPSKEVISRLDYTNSKVYRTDKNGEINVIINDGKISVKTTY